jgi:ABC-type nitrate/sulfonate/bicarbonate transport system permease component
MSEPKGNSTGPDARTTSADTGGPAGASGDPVDRIRPGRPPLVLRRKISPVTAVLCGLACLATCLLLWSFLTAGENEERIMTSNKLPSPAETWAALDDLWYNAALSRNTLVSLRRVAGGFALAVAIGVPLGVLCGCFPMANAFFAPVMIFGRNIPIAALIPLTFAVFGIGEAQKMMFIFIATVAFIVGDTARAIGDVSERYLDTAYTLGANNRQAIFKVLVPLALPSVFNSFRLLFGLAFGYIMLAEIVTMGDTAGGIGSIIQRAQRLGKQEYIILVLMIIPVIALLIDRLLFWVQRELFPHQYGGSGLLRKLVRRLAHALEDCKSLFFKPQNYADTVALAQPTTGDKPSDRNR